MNKAMTKRRDAVMAGEKEQGFTLIELMVVIIIIGILAAIAIPVFLNQRNQAWNASVKSDLANAAIAAETYSVGNNGSYALLTKDALVANGFKETSHNNLAVSDVTATGYVLTDVNSDAGVTYTYTSSTGQITP
ncbi:MAG: prepilin-type N-terminal cleavage/methylation domain-containing protein [Pseudolysinimonas sp.]